MCASHPLRVSLLAPLVELVVVLLGSSDVGDDDNVEGAGSITGSSVGVTAGVVLVLALALAFPGHAGDVDGRLRGGVGGRSAWKGNVSNLATPMWYLVQQSLL